MFKAILYYKKQALHTILL